MSRLTRKHSLLMVFLLSSQQQAVLAPAMKAAVFEHAHTMSCEIIQLNCMVEKLTPDSSKMELTSSRLTSAVSNLGG